MHAYLFAVLLIGCQADPNVVLYEERPLTSQIIDSVPDAVITLTAPAMRRSVSPVVYVGAYADSIDLQTFRWEELYHSSDTWLSSEQTRVRDLRVWHASNITAALPGIYVNPPPPSVYITTDTSEVLDVVATDNLQALWEKQASAAYRAGLMCVYNSGDDTAAITLQDGEVMVIQEAKNPQGRWQPIEFWLYSTCGNSYECLRIAPKHLVIVKTVLYNGDYQTTLRYKLRIDRRVVYSQTFVGRIQKEQFELPDDMKVFAADTSKRSAYDETVVLEYVRGNLPPLLISTLLVMRHSTYRRMGDLLR